MILIHGAPGSRLGFLNAFLTDSLKPNLYDVGLHDIGAQSYKMHDYDEEKLKNFKGKKFYIQLSKELLFLHLFLFFDKNVVLDQTYRQCHYTHKMIFDKCYYSARGWINDQRVINTNLYDYIIPFDKTYDIEYLINLYQQVNGRIPSELLLESVNSTNLVNSPSIPKNHNARVAAAVFNFEHENNYTENHRLWLLNNVALFDFNDGQCLDPDNLFDNVTSMLSKEKYRNI